MNFVVQASSVYQPSKVYPNLSGSLDGFSVTSFDSKKRGALYVAPLPFSLNTSQCPSGASTEKVTLPETVIFVSFLYTFPLVWPEMYSPPSDTTHPSKLCSVSCGVYDIFTVYEKLGFSRSAL